ncbi:putative alpha-ketoglutarate-dependent 2,4-dichlorophenoxyacetate dioxygenase [Pleomassaria siparia CBS 279.74]|uniref:Putative alpha-ketoglutarate-dependent 2,4-dichlorophenoxyacetate dioxygenase n=1 Tax=Pleomassaria siparia CBS 279.74 TaxID=1314801 RepID=A0A6G1KEF1_9PLEO|nr:putative alpha-ketoglutarate-dependent 2,4-dichlorophenoxyacetate dioxygenase [Pleomassaria siparia CBS 279.74]
MISLTTLTRTYENTCPVPSHAGTLRVRGAATEVREGALTIRPVLVSEISQFGAEVSGVDWSRPIPEQVVNQLIAIQDKYAVLIFRKTSLDNARHIAFSQQLGKDLEVNPFFYGKQNDRVGERFLWDRSKYALLLSHGNPVKGGSWTHFADTRRVYADLPQAKKEELEGVVIEHDLQHSTRLASPEMYSNPLRHELASKPPAYHRLVQTAPDGRKTLYLAAHAKTVLGRSLEESQKLIWELIDHCTQPKYVFSMEWLDAGDMVWWDNRQSMHRANPYTTSMTARDVRRSTVIDEGPLAYGVPDEEKRAAGWTPSA